MTTPKDAELLHALCAELRYEATDEDGEVWRYDWKPSVCPVRADDIGFWRSDGTRVRIMCGRDLPRCTGWRDSLREYDPITREWKRVGL